MLTKHGHHFGSVLYFPSYNSSSVKGAPICTCTKTALWCAGFIYLSKSGYSRTDKQNQEKHCGKTLSRLEITWPRFGFAPSNYLEKDHNLLLIQLDESQTSGSRGKGQKVKLLSEQAAPPIPLSQFGFLTAKLSSEENSFIALLLDKTQEAELRTTDKNISTKARILNIPKLDRHSSLE